MTVLILCRDPLTPRLPDRAFGAEAAAAKRLGIATLLIDHDALDRRHDPQVALSSISIPTQTTGVYRGWMLRAEDYALLHQALRGIGISLLNSPAQYAACHHFPEAYPHIAPWSAPSRWITIDRMHDPQHLQAVLRAFGKQPVVLKDWVKSQSYYWHEACFIADPSDLAAVRKVIDRFIALQGDSLTGGLVFRAYVPLQTVSGKTLEWRCFVLDGKPLGCWPRAAAGDCPPPPDALIEAVAAALPSRFATADFARRQDGGWTLIEVGDGQVSELPELAGADALLVSLGDLSAMDIDPYAFS